MGLKGTFKQIPGNHQLGGWMWSFELRNTNLWQKEVYHIGIFDIYRQEQKIWRNQVLTTDEIAVLNYNTVGWLFCQGDTVAILDDNDRIIQQWTLQLREYRPGECPECHGSHVCRTCGGAGHLFPKRGDEAYVTCPDCNGTGVCQTCYIPRREPRHGGAPTGLHPFK